MVSHSVLVSYTLPRAVIGPITAIILLLLTLLIPHCRGFYHNNLKVSVNFLGVVRKIAFKARAEATHILTLPLCLIYSITIVILLNALPLKHSFNHRYDLDIRI